MPGKGSQKRYYADAIRAAKLAADGWTHRNIAEAIGRPHEGVKKLILLGERLQQIPENERKRQ